PGLPSRGLSRTSERPPFPTRRSSDLRAPDGEVRRTFAILTTTANREMSALHDRMPVILEPEAWPVWLGEQEGDPIQLLRPAAEEDRKSTRLNSSHGSISYAVSCLNKK